MREMVFLWKPQRYDHGVFFLPACIRIQISPDYLILYTGLSLKLYFFIIIFISDRLIDFIVFSYCNVVLDDFRLSALLLPFLDYCVFWHLFSFYFVL